MSDTTDRLTQVLREYDKRIMAKREECKEVKPRLMALLRDNGIKYVLVSYTGYGDSGQLELVQAFGPSCPELPEETNDFYDHQINFPDVHATLIPGEDPSSILRLIEDYAWALIESYHDGFENNEGGQGTIAFDTTNDSIVFDHGDNVVDVHHTVHEL